MISLKYFIIKNKKNFIFSILITIFTKTRNFLLSKFALLKWFKLNKNKKIKLELGSGPIKGKNGFTTVDLGGADIFWDLKNGIPLRKNSVELIYSSHLLEHIPFKELIIFLKECKRVLKNNGTFSVCVPDAGRYINSYVKGGNIESEKYYEPALVNTGSKLDQLNYIAYMDGLHKYLFDGENLVNTLLKAGFKKAYLRDFDPKLDYENRDFQSIYAIAKKGQE